MQNVIFGGLTDYSRYDLAAFKLGALNRAAQMLGNRDESLNSELLDFIRKVDPTAADLITNFFAAYDDWYEWSSKHIGDDGIEGDEMSELIDKDLARDEARIKLIAHLAKSSVPR